MLSFRPPGPISRLTAACRPNPRLAAAVVALIALVGLLAGVQAPVNVLPYASMLMPNAALALAALAGALWSFTSHRRRVCQILAWSAAGIGLATFAQYLTGWDLGIDRLLCANLKAAELPLPGRMSPQTAIALMASGAALGLAARRREGTPPAATLLAALPLAPALLGLCGHLTDLVPAFSWGFRSMAVPTSLALITLSLGTLCALQHRSRWLTSRRRSTATYFVTAATTLALVGLTSFNSNREQADSARAVARSQQVLAALEDINAALLPWRPNPIVARAGGDTSPSPLATELATPLAALATLRSLAANDPEHASRLESVEQALGDELARISRSSGAAGAFGADSPLGESREQMQRLILEEKKTLWDRRIASETRAEETNRLIVLGHLMALGMGGIALSMHVRSDRDRRATEAALQRSEACFRTTFEAAPTGMGLVAPDGRWLRVNHQLSQLLGWTPSEATERRVQDSSHPDDLAREKVQLDSLLAGDQPTLSSERRLIHRSGAVAWVRLTATAVRDPSGGLLHFVVQYEDITERRRTEEALQASYRRINDLQTALDEHAIVSVTDARGRITYANDNFVAISGYTREELLGQDHRLLNSGLTPKATMQDMWDTIRSGRVWRGEFRNRAKNGSHYWVDSVIVPFLDDHGAPTQYIAVRTEVTHRKELETSMAAARDLALQASRLKSEFLANMSHEIRTPMNGVMGMTALLLDTSLNDDQREIARLIQSSGDSLLNIINDILDFSKIEAGKLRIDPTTIDLREVLEESLAVLAPRAHAKGLELLCELDPQLPALVLGDGGRIRQVLTNLVGNAIKFTASGEVAVGLQVRSETESNLVRLRFEVRDTGIGIAADAQRHLFQPFIQADGSTTRRFGGTGLGLAISRQLVELMGGTIGFKSEPGAGSTFWFDLELRVEAAARTAQLDPERPWRVLAVDDNATNRRILRGQLGTLGVRGTVVDTAVAAFAALRAAADGPDRFDVVLLDWHLPDIEGLALARQIREEPALADVPLIMLSSAAPPEDPAALEPLRLSALLAKPVRQAQLARAIAQALTLPENPWSALGTHATDGSAFSAPPAAVRPLEVLLAEDNAVNQAVAVRMLQRLGHHVTAVPHGEQALVQLAKRRFDVVFMDCQMPVLDGYEATRRLRSGQVPGADPRVPVVALTAYALATDRAKCLAAGMDDYLSKPLRIEDLQAALRRVLQPGSQVANAATV